MRPVVRHERVLDDDVVTAGALQSRYVPGVDDFVIASRNDEDAPVVGMARHGAAEERPFAMLAAAGIFPPPADMEAAVSRFRHPGRHQRRADQRRVVLAPDVRRRPVVQERDEPGMHADHAIDPGDRHVGLAERHLRLEIGQDVEFVAAPALRLEHLEQSRCLHLGNGFLRQPPVAFALRRATPQRRDHRARPCDHLRG